MSDEPWVGAAEVAAHFGIGKDAVYQWARTPGFPALAAGRPDAKRKTWRFRISDIEAHLKAQREAADPWAMPPASRRKRRAA